jgi:secreted trypsin-like serine protease
VEALMMTQVNLIDTATCNAAYGNRVTRNQICAGLPAGGKDACQGDSGGPLIVEGANSAEDVQVGIVSYGSGCGRAGFPGVYTDVRRYRSWVGESLLVSGAQGGAE